MLMTKKFFQMKKSRREVNQQKPRTNIVKGLQTYLNDLKNYLITNHGFKIRLVILKSLVNIDIF